MPAPATGGALAARLNRPLRGRRARLHFDGEHRFGASLPLRRYHLGNGLRIVTLVDHAAPVVSYQTWFRVGSGHEKPGKTGLAHLFEHMMFSSTKKHAAGELDRRFEAAGADTNAATWTDWTYYYESLPAKALPLAIELESDRMSNLVLRAPEFDSEKEVVANERRYSVDDDVQGAASECLYATAFKRHPYRWPTIGWMPDIEGFTLADCRAFYRTWYAPNNATLVIAGDFDEHDTLGLIQASYGPLSAAKLPERAVVKEGRQNKERRAVITQPTPTAKVNIGYRSPAFAHGDWAILAVLNEILFGGRSSRMHHRLVHDDELCSELSGSVAPFKDPGLYEIWLGARDGHGADELLRAFDEEIAGVRERSVPVAELDKAKNRLELGFLQSLETVAGRAEQVGFYDAVTGAPEDVLSRLDAYRAVTVDELAAAATRYLDPRGRSVVEIRPSGEASS